MCDWPTRLAPAEPLQKGDLCGNSHGPLRVRSSRLKRDLPIVRVDSVARMPPFRVILIDHKQNRTMTFVVPLERVPDVGSEVDLPQGQSVLVSYVMSGEREGLAGIVLAAPAQD